MKVHANASYCLVAVPPRNVFARCLLWNWIWSLDQILQIFCICILFWFGFKREARVKLLIYNLGSQQFRGRNDLWKERVDYRITQRFRLCPMAGFIVSNFNADPLVVNRKKAKGNLGSSFSLGVILLLFVYLFFSIYSSS